VLVISNSSDKRIGGVLSLSDASGKQKHDHWTLAPHQTQRMIVGDLVRKAGLTGNSAALRSRQHRLPLPSTAYTFSTTRRRDSPP